MNHLSLEHQWVEFSGAGEPELDSTFASVEVRVNGESILTVLDKKARATGSQLMVPLYPLAQWAAAWWWSLLEEPFTPGREQSFRRYLVRHSMRYAAEGFAFPDIRILPEGHRFKIEWVPVHSRFQSVDFLSRGHVYVERAEVQGFLSHIVEVVLGRLESRNIPHTWLAAEWAALSALDTDENEFCRLAARLGLDPFDLDDSISSTITSVWNDLPHALRIDVVEAVTGNTLVKAAEWVTEGIERIATTIGNDGLWAQLRAKVLPVNDASPPWIEGNRAAKEVRSLLGISDEKFVKTDTLPIAIVQAIDPPIGSLDAVVAANQSGSPGCYTAKRHPESQRFVQARAIWDLVYGLAGQPVLLSTSWTVRQQRTRAFAAEFLAPADLIRRSLKRSEVSEEEIGDLAASFGVSTFVIEHQIQNYCLAELPTSSE